MDKAKEILNRIKEEKIEPKSRWRFLLKDYLVWAFFAASIFIGGAAFSVIIFLLTDNDWDVYKYLDKNFFSYLLLSLPYVWILALALFFSLAYFNYRHTKSGYKTAPLKLILMSVIASIFIGSIMFISGFGQVMDYALSKNIPYYEMTVAHRRAVWNNPEKGLLAGEIIKFNHKDNFFIESLEGDKWEVRGNDIYWRGMASQEIGAKVKIIGEAEKNNLFRAEEIRPWMGGGMIRHMRQK